MLTRRLILGQAMGLLGASMAAAVLPARAVAVDRNRRLRAVSAGHVRVSPGPWTVLPEMARGVYLENLYLTMPDGVRLNAFLYLPTKAARGGLPCLVETLPYRYLPQNDSYDAQHGFASLCVDIRGMGGSEGSPRDEYTHEEHEDTTLIIDWLSKQPWSNGRVGMYGGSYGAINTLQIAYEMHPPALKAIFIRCGTHELYTDDIFSPGGTQLMVDKSWALGLLTSNAMPGAPDFDLNSAASLQRWETPPWLKVWLHHQNDGPYWRHNSLAPDYSRLKTPTFLVGGTLDINQNFVAKIMRNAHDAVTRGILGPWHHSLNEPGPNIDLEAIRMRWFDHWLKGHDTGLLKEPRVSFYMPRWRRQSFRYTGPIPGEWRFLDDWPETVFEPTAKLFFRPDPEHPLEKLGEKDPMPGVGGRLADLGGPASAQRLRYYPGTGSNDQSYGPTNGEGFYGIDRRADDVYGLCFDTPPLTEPLEMLGYARARLFVSSTAPVANWIVRICDVAPDGTSYLITRGWFNGTHRRSHVNPEPMTPGEIYELEFQLMCTGYRFDPGHRIRVNISNADFPVLWPSPYPMTTTLYTGGDHPSHIALPVLSAALAYRTATLPGDEGQPRETAHRMWRITGRQQVDSSSWYQLTRDLEAGATSAIVNLPFGGKMVCRVADEDPAQASLNTEGKESAVAADGRHIEIYSEGMLRSTVDQFMMEIRCTLTENGKEVRSKVWSDVVKRELV